MIHDLFEVIHKRSSIRAFTDEDVANDDLLTIAEAGRCSPTSVNQQLRKFTIVKNKKMLAELAEAIGNEINDNDYDFYGPNAIILVSVPGASEISAIEVGLAVQNMWLAATALEFGMAWTHQINGLSDRPAVRQVLDKFEVPSHHICLNIMAVGVPAESPNPKRRIEKINLIQ